MPERLTLVAHDAVRGDGQGRVVRELALGALDAGWRVTLEAHAVDADLAARPGLVWRRVPAPRRPIALKKLVFLLRASLRRADGLVHVHGAVRLGRFDLATCHLCHSARDLATARGPAWPAYYRLSNAAQAWLERRLYRTGLVVAVSAKVAAELASAAGVPLERLRVVRPGVDPAEFRPPTPSVRQAARAQLDLRGGEVAALFVGDAVTEQKGLGVLLDAVAEANLARLRLLVAGRYEGGPFQAQVWRLGLGDRVCFLGPRGDVAALLHAADIFILPTRYESFSLATLEAMASGLPVVVSNARFCGAAELIRDGESGLLLDPDRPAALVAVLRALAEDEALRARLGRAARAVAERQTWRAMVARYLALYDGLRRGAPPSQPELDALDVRPVKPE
ncbi:MAG: glycosyltransferase family 4 protein [Chloroflexi bacterium]|nr:glycosyltransferase family 4 protein [Chloroflexota bacterium]